MIDEGSKLAGGRTPGTMEFWEGAARLEEFVYFVGLRFFMPEHPMVHVGDATIVLRGDDEPKLRVMLAIRSNCRRGTDWRRSN